MHVVWYDTRDGNEEIYYKRDGNPVGIININSELPNQFSLSQNYPNPFNPTTKIKFSLPRPSEGGEQVVSLSIYDALGRQIAVLFSSPLGRIGGATYEVDWNASNYPSGVYYYKLQSGDFAETKRMVLIK